MRCGANIGRGAVHAACQAHARRCQSGARSHHCFLVFQSLPSASGLKQRHSYAGWQVDAPKLHASCTQAGCAQRHTNRDTTRVIASDRLQVWGPCVAYSTGGLCNMCRDAAQKTRPTQGVVATGLRIHLFGWGCTGGPSLTTAACADGGAGRGCAALGAPKRPRQEGAPRARPWVAKRAARGARGGRTTPLAGAGDRSTPACTTEAAERYPLGPGRPPLGGRRPGGTGRGRAA